MVSSAAPVLWPRKRRCPGLRPRSSRGWQAASAWRPRRRRKWAVGTDVASFLGRRSTRSVSPASRAHVCPAHLQGRAWRRANAVDAQAGSVSAYVAVKRALKGVGRSTLPRQLAAGCRVPRPLDGRVGHANRPRGLIAATYGSGFLQVIRMVLRRLWRSRRLDVCRDIIGRKLWKDVFCRSASGGRTRVFDCAPLGFTARLAHFDWHRGAGALARASQTNVCVCVLQSIGLEHVGAMALLARCLFDKRNLVIRFYAPACAWAFRTLVAVMTYWSRPLQMSSYREGESGFHLSCGSFSPKKRDLCVRLLPTPRHDSHHGDTQLFDILDVHGCSVGLPIGGLCCRRRRTCEGECTSVGGVCVCAQSHL